MRQAEEYNLQQRQMVENFNRGTNMANSEMGLKASMANQQARQKALATKMQGIAAARSMREQIDAARSAALSENATSLFDNLGNIAVDSLNRDNLDMLLKADVFGTLSRKPYYWSDEEWENYKKGHQLQQEQPPQMAKGGYLTINKKKGHRHA